MTSLFSSHSIFRKTKTKDVLKKKQERLQKLEDNGSVTKERRKSQRHKRISQNLVNPISKLNTKRLAAASAVHRSIAVTVTDYPPRCYVAILLLSKE